MYGPWVRVPASSQREFVIEFLFSFILFTYILFSERLNKHYVPFIDMERRLKEHDTGHLQEVNRFSKYFTPAYRKKIGPSVETERPFDCLPYENF